MWRRRLHNTRSHWFAAAAGAGAFMLALAPACRAAAAPAVSAREAWPLSPGTVRIYDGAVKWTAGETDVRTRAIRWTNEVEWAAANPRRYVAVVRGSLAHLHFEEPPAAPLPPTVMVAEGSRMFELWSDTAAEAYRLAHDLLDRNAPLPSHAQEKLNLPLHAGSDFGRDAETATRDDHWYCWHVEKVESRPVRLPGSWPSDSRDVVTLSYRTLPDHQLVEFVEGVGIIRYDAVHHGTEGEVRLKLVGFQDGVVRAPDSLRVDDVTLFGDMECFRIATASATYFYGKRGAGFASLLDPDGHDWLSYRHGGKALGEYRGLPKCGQPTKYFHCGYGFGQYTNTNPFATTITKREPGRIRLHSETQDGRAACDWDFFSTHATMTLLRIPGRYWFLYEGTPGGELHPTGDFVIRAGRRKTPLTEPWKDDVPWMVFGAQESPFGLLCVAHQASPPVSYVSWPYKPEADGSVNQMTVAGFGRPDWQDPRQHTPPLEALPARFSVAVLSQATAAKAAVSLRVIEEKLPRPQ